MRPHLGGAAADAHDPGDFGEREAPDMMEHECFTVLWRELRQGASKEVGINDAVGVRYDRELGGNVFRKLNLLSAGL